MPCDPIVGMSNHTNKFGPMDQIKSCLIQLAIVGYALSRYEFYNWRWGTKL